MDDSERKVVRVDGSDYEPRDLSKEERREKAFYGIMHRFTNNLMRPGDFDMLKNIVNSNEQMSMLLMGELMDLRQMDDIRDDADARMKYVHLFTNAFKAVTGAKRDAAQTNKINSDVLNRLVSNQDARDGSKYGIKPVDLEVDDNLQSEGGNQNVLDDDEKIDGGNHGMVESDKATDKGD